MIEATIEHEPALRFAAFLGVFALVALWEAKAPRRVQSFTRRQRWPHNLGLLALDVLAVRLLAPAATIAVAIAGETQGWGLLNVVALPTWAQVLAAVVALDLAIYFQHVLFHAVPALWRLHRVHHADLDYDVTTGARFHPIEIALSMLIKFATITVLGPPVLAVVVFEVLLNATAMFNHGNIRIPAGIDRVVRWFVVTPDMHRVHHSVEDDETNSNFGFNLPWWDRLFGTYRAQPRAGHEAMTIGIHGHADPHEVARLDGMLMLPFRGEVDGYAINRRDWHGEQVTR